MNFMSENPKRALLVIDVQNEYFTGQLPITYPAGSLTNSTVACMEPPRRWMGRKLVVKNLDEFRTDGEKVQPAEFLEHTPDRRSQAG